MMSLVVEDGGVVDDEEANEGRTRRRRGVDGNSGWRVRDVGDDGERTTPRAAAVDDDGTKPATVETTSGINASIAEA